MQNYVEMGHNWQGRGIIMFSCEVEGFWWANSLIVCPGGQRRRWGGGLMCANWLRCWTHERAASSTWTRRARLYVFNMGVLEAVEGSQGEAITLADYAKAPVIATPINIMDSSPVCDGAAAVVLVPTARAHEFTTGHHRGAVKILAGASANDTLAVHDRRDPLFLEAAYISSQKAYSQAGVYPEDLDLFELHDAFSIMSALSLEANGFAARGEGWRLAQDDEIGLNGRIPISTMGGLKSRGHPVGATGIYQIVELVQQLTGEAGANQVRNARLGMAQNIGGSGATIVTHILGT
ncbi:MAG: hypothetical protein R2854_02095 [Caldilineaceae bacterium]